MKHTKGPWKYESGQVERMDGAVIARMDRSNAATEAGIYPTERDANAKLIAAAPELLEALKAMQCMCAAGCDRCAKQKSAIAKAEGRTE